MWVLSVSTRKYLINMKENGILTIININAGSKAHRFLADLGIHTGEKIKVIKNDSGPVVIEVKGTKVAIGRGLAAKIEVS